MNVIELDKQLLSSHDEQIIKAFRPYGTTLGKEFSGCKRFGCPHELRQLNSTIAAPDQKVDVR
jgi:hypothetical protein